MIGIKAGIASVASVPQEALYEQCRVHGLLPSLDGDFARIPMIERLLRLYNMRVRVYGLVAGAAFGPPAWPLVSGSP
jgi:hypothetical protein